MAALGVDSLESIGFAEPARAEAVGHMKSSADDTEAVDPTAVAANTLTHSKLLLFTTISVTIKD
jgi:hypothetical protein